MMGLTNKYWAIFAVSLLATIAGLYILVDTRTVVSLLGWEEDGLLSIYLRGFLLLFGGCWFLLMSRKQMVRLKKLRQITGAPVDID